MGVVYTAKDRLRQRTVALKRLLPNTYNATHLQFAHEFQTMAGLRHPHIIDVIDYGFEADKTPFFTMQKLDGAVPILPYAMSVSRDEQIELIIQILQALIYLHRHNIVHRDLKPSNIMVSNGRAVLLDFGLSVRVQEDATEMSRAGSLAYMAPEVVAGEASSPASDLFAVGLILYEMLFGRHPYDLGAFDRVLQQASQANIYIDEQVVGHELGMFLSSLLMKDVNLRIDSAADALIALCVILDRPLPAETQRIRDSLLQRALFVNRERELETVSAALQRAFAGQVGGILIGGESGVGKSRLIDEVRIRALVDGATVLLGQALIEGNQPLQMWRNILPHLVLKADLTDIEGGILKEIVPNIDSLLQRPFALVEPLNHGHQKRLLDTVLALFQRIDAPLLIILEDIHWLDDDFALLKTLLNEANGHKLLIIATYRSDERPKLPTQLPMMDVLQLGRLGHNEIAILGRAMLGETGGEDRIVSFLARETEGNALFIVEVMRILAEQAGSLDLIGTQTSLPAHVLPRTVEALLLRRLANVPEQYRPLVDVAAVFGRQLDLVILRYFADSDTAVDQLLFDCAQMGIFELNDEQWRFSHDKLHAVTLQEVPNLVVVSQRVAAAIEQLYPKDVDTYETLYRLWQQAEEIDKALAYLNLLTKRLLHYAAGFARCVMLCEQALDLLPPDDIRRLPFLDTLILVYEYQAKIELSQQTATALHTLAQQHNDRYYIGRGLYALGYLASHTGQYELVPTYLLEARRYFDPQDHENLSEIYYILGNMRRRLGQYDEAFEHLQQALFHAESAELGYAQAKACLILGLSFCNIGDLGRGGSYLERAHALLEAVGSQTGIAVALNQLAYLAIQRGAYHRAESYGRDAKRANTVAKIVADGGLIDMNLATAVFHQGRHAEARQGLLSALEQLKSVRKSTVYALVLQAFGDLCYSEGTFDEAVTWYEQAHVLNEALNSATGVAKAQFGLGLVALQRGEEAAALTAFKQCRTTFAELGEQISLGRCNTFIGLVYLRLGNAASANILADALKAFQMSEAHPRLLEVLIGYAWLRWQKQQATEAATLLAFVQQHPSYAANMRWLGLDELENHLVETVTPAAYQEISAQAKQLTLASAVKTAAATH